MAKIMHSVYTESEQDEKQRYSQESQHADTLVRMPALRSSIPPRASAHPSALAAVRAKYPRRFTDLEQMTQLDITRVPTLPHRSEVGPEPPELIGAGVLQRRTDDLPTEHIFCNVEDKVSVEEIDTFPPDVQARLRPGASRAEDELAELSSVGAWPVSSVQGQEEEVYHQFEARQAVETQLPDNIGASGELRRFSNWRYLDDVRWWLLIPGRLEFLLGVIGVIVLVCFTSFFMLVIILSLGLFGSRI